MAPESAEEKLLKLMQKSSSPSVAKPSSSPSPKKKFKMSFSISALNKLLFLGIVICIAGLVYELRSGMALLSQSALPPSMSKAETAAPQTALSAPKGVEYYLRPVNERNIFRPYVAKPVAKRAAAQDLAHRMSKYKLVGIAWLDLPETATIMIEDPRKKDTFFLKQGEQLEGVTVKTIYTDRVVFSHENEETTIKL
jgi:hypothetical protein